MIRFTFRVDQNDSMVVVDIEGSHKGPSRYAVPKNTRLQALAGLH